MQYRPMGVCSRQINVELDGDTIKSVEFVGGCAGNFSSRQRNERGRGHRAYGGNPLRQQTDILPGSAGKGSARRERVLSV